MNISKYTLEQEINISNSFQLFEESLNGLKDNFIHTNRKKSLTSFHKLGIPTIKDEQYKYTNLRAINPSKLNFKPIDAVHLKKEEIDYYTFPQIKSNKLIFVNGRLSQELSEIIEKEKLAVVGSFYNQTKKHPEFVKRYFSKIANYEQNGIIALNTAFTNDGAFIHIPEGCHLEYPVLILNLLDSTDPNAIIQPRNLIMLEKGAKATIIDSNRPLSPLQEGVTNAVSEIFIAENASLDLYKLQLRKQSGTWIDHTIIDQQKNSLLKCHTINFGGELIRNNLHIILNQAGCECRLYGAYLPSANEHVDNWVLVEHKAPHCNSNQLYKGILDENATGVFSGKIYVYRDAQKTNAFQTNRNILLSDNAIIYSKPQLEIYADDVKCSHGATSGQLDRNALFYLRSRGLELETARAVMTYAFVAEVFGTVGIEELKETLLTKLAHELNLNI